MKQLILCVIFSIALSTVGLAQNKSGSKSKTTHTAKHKKTTKATPKKPVAKKPANLNQRKIYHWKDGQRATPTGHEAAPTGGGYVSLKKDTVAVKPKDN